MVLRAWREVGGDLATLVVGEVVRRSGIGFAAPPGRAEAGIARWHAGFAAVRADGPHAAVLARDA